MMRKVMLMAAATAFLLVSFDASAQPRRRGDDERDVRMAKALLRNFESTRADSEKTLAAFDGNFAKQIREEIKESEKDFDRFEKKGQKKEASREKRKISKLESLQRRYDTWSNKTSEAALDAKMKIIKELIDVVSDDS